jgi:formate dehydrogenase assembly factor FdhD
MHATVCILFPSGSDQNENMDRNDTVEQSEENITEKPKKAKNTHCGHCSDMIPTASFKRHTMSCPIYQKLIINSLDCMVCTKTFESRKKLYSHIGKIHKAALVELKKGW